MMIIGDINYKRQKYNQKIVKLKPSKIVVGDHVRYKIEKEPLEKGIILLIAMKFLKSFLLKVIKLF